MDENKEKNETTTQNEPVKAEQEKKAASPDKTEKKENSKLRGENKKLTDALNAKTKEYDELNDRYLRMIAEYDNFRKRSQKERESVYSNAYADVLAEFLPMTDNLERSLAYAGSDNFVAGIKLIVNQFADTLKKLGIEEFGVRGDVFDPNLHNAVMRTEDETLGENTVAEVLQKGYRKGDRILRHAMVKVAN